MSFSDSDITDGARKEEEEGGSPEGTEKGEGPMSPGKTSANPGSSPFTYNSFEMCSFCPLHLT